MKLEYYLIAGLFFCLVALAVYVWFKFRLLNASQALDTSDLREDLNNSVKTAVANVQRQVTALKQVTPRYTINQKNEVVLILPDGKTEILNYKLNAKKK